MPSIERMVDTGHGKAVPAFLPILHDLTSSGLPFVMGRVRRGDKNFKTTKDRPPVALKIIAPEQHSVRCELLSSTVRQEIYIPAIDESTLRARIASCVYLHHDRHEADPLAPTAVDPFPSRAIGLEAINKLAAEIEATRNLLSDTSVRVEIEARIVIAQWRVFQQHYAVTDADRERWQELRLDRMRRSQQMDHERFEREFRMLLAEERLRERGQYPALRTRRPKEEKTCGACGFTSFAAVFGRYHSVDGSHCRTAARRAEEAARIEAQRSAEINRIRRQVAALRRALDGLEATRHMIVKPLPRLQSAIFSKARIRVSASTPN